MWTLALACAFFLMIHLMISGTSLKEQVIARVGAPAYFTLFSILSIGGLLWMSIAFTIALGDQMNHVFWKSGPFLRVIGLVGNLFSMLLLVIGLTTPSPTNLIALVKAPETPVYGIIRVSRHPVLAGIGVWALTHLICNGNLAAWIFFGSILALCALGANNIDRKRTATMGKLYASIERRTSIIPFVAIMEGRTAFAPEELGVARALLAVSTYSVITVLHELLFTSRAF